MSFEQDSPGLIVCTSGALVDVSVRSAAYACWLHILKMHWEELPVVVRNLTASGCDLLYVTGCNPTGAHDAIDDCLIHLLRTDVLTACGGEDLVCSALEFWDLSRRYAQTRLVAVIGNNRLDEYRVAGDLLMVLRNSDFDR
jgi:hypothetical protein